MIFSISPRCVAVKLSSAWAAKAPSVSVRPAARARRGRKRMEVVLSMFNVMFNAISMLRAGDALGACEIVSLYPAGRADREASLGARCNLARGGMVAAHEGGHRGSEIGLGEIALVSISHGELQIAVHRFGLLGKRGPQ